MRRFVPVLLSAAVACASFACGASTRSQFVEACQTETNLSEEICSCAGDRAEDELTPETFALLTAMMAGDDERSAELRAELSVTEIAAAGMFLVTGPARCAKDLVTD